MIIGTAALVLVLSVFNGFEDLVKSLYSTFYTDLRVSPASGKIMTVTPEQLQKMKGIIGIRNYTLVVEEKAMLQNGDDQSLVFIKGVDENYRYVTGVADHIVTGEYNLGDAESPHLILGAGVEGALGVEADRNIFGLDLYLPKRDSIEQDDPLNAVYHDSVGTSAAFLIQQDFDNKYVITNLAFMKKALQLRPDEYGGIEISLKDPEATTEIRTQLRQVFGSNYQIQTRYEQNQSLYSIMTMERWVIYAVLCLILVVAAFNMIGSLTMLVLEKQKDISVLHALGGNRGFIQKIFLGEGMLLAIIGGGIGMLIAFIIALLQLKFHLISLAGGSFLIDYFPVSLKGKDFLLVGATVFVISLIASWLPARKAASQEFSLRSE